jgi:hypothetical protein
MWKENSGRVEEPKREFDWSAKCAVMIFLRGGKLEISFWVRSCKMGN